MLSVSEEAARAIHGMLAEAGLGEGAGLRLSAELDEDGSPGLYMEFVDEPEEGDEVVETGGVRVFLDPSAADALENKVLEAEAHGDHFHFGLGDR